ncbi:hypothetical protein H257_12360 [Aphanomyces astaci]|uniref:glucan endo-1,3-beta-D-glucosidase n=1 Tax=Aphanomyces astaci TaxID=112090 RepID=W4FYR9_APHAT|nr:hypothetical protein H257_12360 [Aphanomyces astaci]ETV72602.1 hypothetical protein H257_12360 [Aphanomyces astaci]|eukprot:XP_009837830.1 hypothetical protein H257_12360 [Aphanomyces astaci]
MKVLSSFAIAAAFAASSVAALDAKFYGINYDVRTSQWGGCKDFHTIAEDFNILKEVTNNVRIYGTDFECAKNVIEAAHNSGLKVWLGLWSEVGTTVATDSFPSQNNALKELVNRTKLINNDDILGIQVSSEALYRYYVLGPGSDRRGIDTVVGYLRTVQSYLRDHDLTFPVVISDNMDMYTKFPELYDEVDVVAVNQFSFRESKTAEEGAHFTFKRFQEQETRAKRAGKLILLHETGWSTAGESPKVREASPRAQGVFTQDFLTLAARQNLNAFYYVAFDLPFNPTEIERNFGIYNADREMKPEVEAVHVGAPLQAVRLWAGDNVIKAHRYWNADDDSVNENFGSVYAAKPSVGPLGVLDDEIWLWDAASSILYSKSSNQCLDSYGDLNTQTLHTYDCSKVNHNQKWSVANGNIASQNDANFCIDVDVKCSKTPDGNLVVAMYRCNGHQNQLISMVPAADEPLEIGIKTNGGVLTEWFGKVTWETSRKDNADCHQWFYDPVTQLIASKSHRGMCLDAYERKNYGVVHLYSCSATNVNQKWVVNDITGQIHHATHIGFCLDGPDNANGLVHLWSCYKTEANQKWSIKPVKA